MKKKVLLIVLPIIIIISIIIVLVFVNQQSTTESAYGDVDNSGYDYFEENQADDYEEETTQAIKLSDNCDKIFATGTDKNGNFYELVANQEETYEDVKIQIGVIKNNKWLLEPTSDMPFIDKETGLIKIEGFPGGSTFGIDDIKINDYGTDDIYGTFEYVADGCFCIYEGITKDMSWTGDCNCSIVYNAENKKAYYNEKSNFIFTSSLKEAKYGDQLLIQDKYSIGGLPFEEFRSDFYILDTNTMKTKMIVEGTEYDIMGSLCDGLFAVGDSMDGYKHSIMYFYDLEGNQVIDLTSYNDGEVYGVNGTCFADGKFTFLVKNNAGTEFQVTIDTKGNVVSSVESSKQN